MSFYRITDPKRRDAMVADYIATVKRIKERNLAERLGSLADQNDISKTLNPIIQSNERTSTAITNELQPIKQEIEELNKHMRETTRGVTQGRKRKNFAADDDEPIVGLTSLLEGDHSRQDMYFGIQRNKDNRLMLGNKEIEVDQNNKNIRIDGNIYTATPGLVSLIMDISPKKYTKEDFVNYKKIVLQTDLINNPSGLQPNSRPKQTNKYKNYLAKIVNDYKAKIEEEEKEDDEEEDEEEEDEDGKEEEEGDDNDNNDKGGSGIQFLPSTIKGLFEKLKLLAAEFIAGNTNTRNELIAVLDQLRNRSLITEKEYTTINTLVSQ